MRQSVELDDSSLVEIFSKVGDARQITQCSLVCKRWRELHWAVSRLHFDFTVSSKEALRDREGIISDLLRRAKKIAPGCLKELKVSLSSGILSCDEVTGHWLLWPDSLTLLELDLCGGLAWGPTVWTLLSCFRRLEIFRMAGRFYSKDLRPLADEPPFRTLQSCHFSRARSVSAGTLEALLAACPTLESLAVTGFDDFHRTLALKSASLKRFRLLGVRGGCVNGNGSYTMALDAPKLASLKVGYLVEGMFVGVAHPRSLCELELFGRCVLECKQQCCDNLKSLKIIGNWDDSNIFGILSLTPMITELSFEKIDSEYGMAIGDLLGPLVNLKTIHFDGASIKSFERDLDHFRFGALTVHLWVDSLDAPDLDFLRDLLLVHGILMLVVHYSYKEMIDSVSQYMHECYESWRALFDLMLSFPGRISLLREEKDSLDVYKSSLLTN